MPTGRSSTGHSLRKRSRRMSNRSRHPSLMPEPVWARWNPAAAERPWTIGIEEEVILLDPVEWTTAPRILDVLTVLPAGLAQHTSPETHASVLELKTSP